MELVRELAGEHPKQPRVVPYVGENMRVFDAESVPDVLEPATGVGSF